MEKTPYYTLTFNYVLATTDNCACPTHNESSVSTSLVSSFRFTLVKKNGMRYRITRHITAT